MRFFILVLMIPVLCNSLYASNEEMEVPGKSVFKKWENYYLKFSSISKTDSAYNSKISAVGGPDDVILNELAYINVLINRSYTERPFLLLQSIKKEVFERKDYFKGVYCYVLARLYFSLNMPDKALDNNRKAIAFLKPTVAFEEYENSLVNQGYYLSHTDLKTALVFFQKALQLEQDKKLPLHIGLRACLAYFWIAKGNISEAEHYYQQGITWVNSHANSTVIDRSRMLSVLSSLYAAKGNNEKAFEIMEEVKQLARDYNMMDLQKNIALQQADYYAEKSDYKMSNRYLKEVDQLEKLISMGAVKEAVAVYDLKNEIKRKKTESERIRKIADLTQRQKEMLIMIVVIISLAFLVIMIMWLSIRTKNRVLIRQNRQLVKAEIPRMKEVDVSERKDHYSPLILELEKCIFDKKMYENPNLTLEKLAKKLNTNRTYLSEAINVQYQLSYSSWLNEVRIDAARKLLNSPAYDHFSIEGIAKTVGYSAISSFNSSFKKITGLTPSQFKKNREEADREIR